MSAAPNTLTSEEIAEGFELLFDGKSLEHFRSFKKDEIDPKWQAIDGNLVLTEGGAGDIITRKQFADFEFRFEFNISVDGNSGVMWRVTEDSKNTYDSGPEFQILDSHSKVSYLHEISKKNIAGALYDFLPAKPEDFKGPDQWNEGVIRVQGTRIQLWLNGAVTADIDSTSDLWKELLAKSKFADWEKFNKMPSGYIALQDHNDRVAFRSLRIKEL
ncbi:DUF1080 domain-containing protein [Luteolibacter pohnpeiensis]|uniref:DUF1080 domain-containing protein n=1 Tax=Luteolibacter pohnpeiensis TaxID=454153 RepID=A0A934S695_9BACT|nr:DUF1080 domain-containing protein [Luteolibacter pohnpeiensis]MBK1882643.1 DUF1080 domain-containing protein [Luteolibacter pohnpeiensis]